MSPRQARRERREAERKAKKLELKKTRLQGNQPRPAVSDFPEVQPRWNPELEDEFPREEQIRHNAIADRNSLRAGLPIPPPGPSPSFGDLLARRQVPSPPPPSKSEETGFVSQRRTVADRASINRANAAHSTGPRTADGKLASSRNSTKHGLAAGTLIIPGEDPAAFEALLNDLLQEHQPAGATEELLLKEMAQSFWLAQRAIRLQNTCFTADGINEKQLALFLRYGTTHERRFYRALKCLLQLKKEASRHNRGFVSQPSRTPAPDAGFVSQTEVPGVDRSESSTPLPGWTIPLIEEPFAFAVR